MLHSIENFQVCFVLSGVECVKYIEEQGKQEAGADSKKE
jgi:hypothetical protein